jgi:hypothetical protein
MESCQICNSTSCKNETFSTDVDEVYENRIEFFNLIVVVTFENITEMIDTKNTTDEEEAVLEQLKLNIQITV